MQNQPSKQSIFAKMFQMISYGQKVFFFATIPLILAVAAIALLVQHQTRQLSEKELASLEAELLGAKEAELQNYMSVARHAYGAVYGNAGPNDEEAKLKVTQILSSLIYGKDGFFFVYDYDVNNLVSPRQTHLITKNWSGNLNSEGRAVADEIVKLARSGGGYLRYLWPKPSTGKDAEMVTYVIGLPDWQWAIGTGIFIDDVVANLAATRAETRARIRQTSWWIFGITVLALTIVFLSGMFINIRERRLADAKLKQLTQRIFDAQEEERSRVARELHDGISQILVSVRYALELSMRFLPGQNSKAAQSISKGQDSLNLAITEIRRISRDLRPSILDDLGLGPALHSLISEFGKRTDIETNFETVVFRNRLDQDSKTALFRVAQEALTNIERHAQATRVNLQVYGHRKGATLRIVDNGIGMNPAKIRSGGLGMRNMQERIEHLGGTLAIISTSKGTTIEANVPLTRILKSDLQPSKAA